MFFGKVRNSNREEGRVPPGQHVTTKFPVLHHGEVPDYPNMDQWDLTVFGLVEQPGVFTYSELMSLPQKEVECDIHCVTGWSRLDNKWRGLSPAVLLKYVRVKDNAKHVILHAEEGWTTNLPIEDFLKDTTILAHSYNHKPLTPEHGFPLRAVMPHLYFWKSAKWLRKIEFSAEDKPGFWERNGYHNYGNPWRSQRYQWD